MKTKKKALLLVMCALLLVGATVMGTLAYLTSKTDTVTNTFSVGNVTITLDEAPVDAYGKETDGARVTKNTYPTIIPGAQFDKDPTVHVAANSEACWLFVKVVDGLASIEGDVTVANQITTKGWTKLDGVDNVYYKEHTEKSEDVEDYVVFETVTIKTDATNENLTAVTNKTIEITAYAIQKDAELDTASEAWAAGKFS